MTLDPSRRHALAWLSGLAAGSTLATLPAWARPVATPVAPAQAFASTFIDVPDAWGPTRVPFKGRLPAGLAGTLYRNGPGRMQRGPTTWKHWFDGDGMVQALRLADGRLEHRGRAVDTVRRQAEERAGRFLWSGFGTAFDDARSVRSPDEVNVGNISVLPVGGELLALWEAGSAWRLDPQTLATRGRFVMSPETDGMPFSAHPRMDPDGRIWSFGYATGSGRIWLYDLNRSGALQRVAAIEAPNADMVHDFAITERQLVFLLTPVLRRPGQPRAQRAFMEQLQWHPERPSVVVVVDKTSLKVTHQVELPNLFAFHFGNAWVDGDRLSLEVARSAGFDAVMRSIQQATVGQPVSGQLAQRPVELQLNLRTGSAQLVELPLAAGDFPRHDQRHTGLRTGTLLMMGRDTSLPDEAFGFNTVQRMDRRRQQVATFSYGSHTLAEEHLFVARPGAGEGRGWVIGTAFDWRARQTRLSVFDAEHLADGPLAQASLPYALPLGLHGQFVAG